MNFRIYANGIYGIEKIATVYSEEEVFSTVSLLDKEVYDRILVIQHDIEKNCDEVFFSGSLGEPKKKKRR